MYNGKTVLITGHTGFKGSWLSIWLHMLGANVIGFALDPINAEDNFSITGIGKRIIDIRGDITNLSSLYDVMNQHKPEFVFHLAAQSLVLQSYEDPVLTYNTNVMGTLHVLEAVRRVESVRSCVLVTTDKCYENREHVWGYRETDALGGYDPYSSSKACAELLISSYRNSYFNKLDYSLHRTALASVRAGNVIGGGDWSNNRLIPDCFRAIRNGDPIIIRNPQSIRPWQHVLEPLYGYLLLASRLYLGEIAFAEAWNFGPNDSDTRSVEWIVKRIIEKWRDYSKYSIIPSDGRHEANYLKLDCSKAKNLLDWQPRWSLETALDKIVEWNQQFYEGSDMLEVCKDQINSFLETYMEV